MVKPFYAPALRDWIDNRISERTFRRMLARIDVLCERVGEAPSGRDPEDPLEVDLGDALAGLIYQDGRRIGVLTYYITRDRMRVNFLNRYFIKSPSDPKPASAGAAIEQARALMRKARASRDDLSNLRK